METIIKLNGQVAGKDKVARLLQYSCRAIWDSLNHKDEAQIALISQLKNLEYILSSFRKCEYCFFCQGCKFSYVSHMTAKIDKADYEFLRNL